MNPVEKVNHRLRPPDIDYELRPDSFWLRYGWVLVAKDATVIRDANGQSLLPARH
jgi:hypothetical protein